MAAASEFWKYFRDVLSWGLIQSPGPLQAVVRGAALALDQLRDDVVYSHHDTPESPRMSGQDSLKDLFGAVNPSSPHTAGSVAAMVQGTPLHNQAWKGKRESRRWWEYVGQTAIRSEES